MAYDKSGWTQIWERARLELQLNQSDERPRSRGPIGMGDLWLDETR